MKLYLIRHPAVRQEPGQNAAEWPLSEKGRQQARMLAALPWWAEVARLFTSAEGKTVETAAIIRVTYPVLPVVTLVDLNEARRPAEWVRDEEYRQRVARFFDYPDEPAAPSWETAQAVTERVVGTVTTLVNENQGQNLALISHGLALTLYRAHLLGRPATLADWQLLSMGCWAIAEPQTGQLYQDWTRLN